MDLARLSKHRALSRSSYFRGFLSVTGAVAAGRATRQRPRAGRQKLVNGYLFIAYP